MVGKALAKVATKIIDNLEIAKFGATLQKAQFKFHKWTSETSLGSPSGELEFFLNPETIKIVKELEMKEDGTPGHVVPLKYSHTKPLTLEIGELFFDTYDTRESVREKYIDKLEALLDYSSETHVPDCVLFNWGQFSMGTKFQTRYVFMITKLDVTYTLFLPSGMPVRATAAVCMRQIATLPQQNQENPKQSPDHARIYTVKRGDTLQGISQFAYESPLEWRRIAESNGIDDPLSLRPGQRLMLPPILK
jgi:hypothetical protein